MLPMRFIVTGFIACLACSKAQSNPESGAGSGSEAAGAYAAVNGDSISMEFKSDGRFVMSAGSLGTTAGTYTVDGEKLIVGVDQQTHTFIRDGNCIADQLNMFGKLCKGGKAGDAANVSTRNVPATPSGTWVATNADGEFRLEFQPDSKLRLTATPPGGQPATRNGTFSVEGDVIHATLDQSEPMVLKFVNDAYESTSFGLAMRFVKQ